jgi:hypothetical protein
LLAADGAPGDAFGSSVAISKSTVVVGAPDHHSATGSAYVFARSGTAWSQQAEVTAADGAANDEFGSSAAVSGSTVVVGAPRHTSLTGAAYAFAGSGAVWSAHAELIPVDGDGGDWFGTSVATSGSTALVGAPFDNSLTGSAYVYVKV